jgi:predicted glycosyltransferase
VLDHAVDGANLVFHADLVIGAGGTMTREAAAMRVPSYTLFAGRMAAVDRTLIDEGRIVWIRSAADLDRIEVRRKPPKTAWRPDPASAERIVDLIEEAAEAVCSRR